MINTSSSTSQTSYISLLVYWGSRNFLRRRATRRKILLTCKFFINIMYMPGHATKAVMYTETVFLIKLRLW